jgi:membrane protein implicated in regulation of membrane protease activity
MDLQAMDIPALGVWAWFLAGIVLMLLELVVPGVFLIWLGLAAVATGLVDLVVALSWQRELLLFAVLAIASAILGRNMMRREASRASDRPFLNRRAEALVGRVFVLAEPIVAGAGRVRVDDSVWRVVGPDQPAGATVRVKAVEGSALVVEPAPPATS